MTSRSTTNLVIGFLGLIALGSLAVATILLLNDKNIPDFISGLGFTSTGAIGGILSKANTDEATPVTVVNETYEPVPTEPQT